MIGSSSISSSPCLVPTVFSSPPITATTTQSNEIQELPVRTSESNGESSSQGVMRQRAQTEADYPTHPIDELLSDEWETDSEEQILNPMLAILIRHQEKLIRKPYLIHSKHIVVSSELSGNGEYLLTYDNRGILRLGSAFSRRLPTKIIGFSPDRKQVAFSTDGKWLAWRDPFGLLYKRLSPGSETKRQPLEGICRGEFAFSSDNQSLILSEPFYRSREWREENDETFNLNKNIDEINRDIKKIQDLQEKDRRDLALQKRERLSLKNRLLLSLSLTGIKEVGSYLTPRLVGLTINLATDLLEVAFNSHEEWKEIKRDEHSQKLFDQLSEDKKIEVESLDEKQSNLIRKQSNLIKMNESKSDSIQIKQISLASNQLTSDIPLLIRLQKKVKATVLSSDGCYFFTVKKEIEKWSIETGKSMGAFSLPILSNKSKLDKLVSSQTGRWLAFTLLAPIDDQKKGIHLYLWPNEDSLLEAGSATDKNYFHFSFSEVTRFAFSPSEKWLAILFKQGHLKILNTASKESADLEGADSIHTFSWGTDNKLYTINQACQLREWNIEPRLSTTSVDNIA